MVVMAALVAAGWPAAFCFVFDAPWRALAALVGWGERLLGAEGVTVEPSVFAWRCVHIVSAAEENMIQTLQRASASPCSALLTAPRPLQAGAAEDRLPRGELRAATP